MKSLKHFNFKFYIRTAQGQEFLVRSIGLDAVDYDTANKELRKIDLPFHHFSTVKSV